MSDKNLENDRYLVDACIKKDMEAWSCLIKKYSVLVSLSIKNRLKIYNIPVSGHDIEDIRQNVFADIWKGNKLESVLNRDDISYWIAIVSGNAALAHFRQKDSAKMRRTVSLSEKIDERELQELIPLDASSPKDELSRAELSDSIDNAIESLPPKEKIIVKLHLIHERKFDEISEILNVPKGTVSSCVKRAKERLRKKLKDFLQ
jgi:RNA polymerase sigma-70 factor, ECF subfamily